MSDGDWNLERLADHILEHDNGHRQLIAIAGPPGVGKSTFSEGLAERLNSDGQELAAVLPMDGFHFDDWVLEARGDRARKGAPHTFDVGGLTALLKRVKANEEPEIAVPVFDRDIEISRAGASIIDQSVTTVIVEGNYLLLDRPGWENLHGLFELTVLLTAPIEVIQSRLTQRWQGYGFDSNELADKLEGNDLPNVRMVLGESIKPKITISTDQTKRE